jgi:opacity protein-like surface antigen
MKRTAWLAGLAAVVLGSSAALSDPYSGFYIRGDVGGAISTSNTFHDTDPTSPVCSLCFTHIFGDTDSSLVFDGGIGYRFTPWLRIDGTLSDLPSQKFSGANDDPTNPFTFSNKFESFVGMANGYIDFAGLAPHTFYWVQPFVVGSIGFSRNRFSDGFLVGPGFTQTITGDTETNFAWGVGGGAGIPIDRHLTLDVTYEYFDLGEARSGTIVTDSVLGVFPPVTPFATDLRVNTVKAGLRYSW